MSKFDVAVAWLSICFCTVIFAGAMVYDTLIKETEHTKRTQIDADVIRQKAILDSSKQRH